MKKSIVLFVVLSLLILNSNAKDKIGVFVSADCPIELPEELIKSGKFSYGYMKVSEFYNKPDGNTIELAVAIFKCKSESATLEPLVLCSGGPGSSNIDAFVPQLAGGLGNLFLNNRDVVIIESRGLKYSKPYLYIDGIEELQLSLLEKNLTADETIDFYLDKLKSSYNRFIDEGINLSAYNSLEISNEIAYVMRQLGYDKFSIFGTSYGTLVTQYLLMNHSDRLTSVVMNGTMDINLGGYHMHTSLINTLNSIFEKCENDPELSSAYPDLKNRFLDMLAGLNEKPDTIMATYWVDENAYKVVLNGNRISVWLFSQMYANTQIPLSIHKLVSGDYSEIIESPGMIFPLHEFSMGLSLSVFLSETPDIKPVNIPIDGEYADLVKGSSLTLFTPYFWDKAKYIWNVEGTEPNKSIDTDVPVLLLAGEMDYLCLPAYASKFAKQHENSYLYLFKGVAHSPVDQGDCAIMMLKEFFDNPTKAPDDSCVKEFQHEFIVPE